MHRALVTGGSGGIGSAIAKRLAADGCHVYIHANRGIDKAIDLSKEITAQGGSAAAQEGGGTASTSADGTDAASAADGGGGAEAAPVVRPSWLVISD